MCSSSIILFYFFTPSGASLHHQHPNLWCPMYASGIIGSLLASSLLATALPCDSPFFDLTAENFEASGVANYYASWAASASLKPEFTSLGEVKCFFYDHLGARDVECGVSRMGCTGLPSCEGILDLVRDAETARRIYFIGRVLDNMSLFAGLIYVGPHYKLKKAPVSSTDSYITTAAGYNRCANRYVEHSPCSDRNILLATRCKKQTPVQIHWAGNKGYD